MNKPTQLTFLTVFLVGALSATATAQPLEPPTLLALEETEATSSNDSQPLPLASSPEPSQASPSASVVEHNEPNPVNSPQTLAELDLPPRTLSEAGFPQQSVHPEPLAPSDTNSEISQTPETTEAAPAIQFRPRIGAQFTTGEGVGYEDSFVGIEGFVPLAQTPERSLTFLEGRLILSTDDAEPGANLVAGHRIYNANLNRTLGGYIAYDFRDTGENTFHQLGAGVETLGESWDARLNAYVPIGDNRQLAEEDDSMNIMSLFPQPEFRGNFLAIGEQQRQVRRRYEAALTGVDAEVGIPITSINGRGDVRGYAGLYFYDGPGTGGFLGGRIRAEARFIDRFRVGLSLQTDDKFGTNLVLSLGVNFPGTRPSGIDAQDNSVLARMAESVVRQENIVVDEQTESFNTLETLNLINPDTEEPYFFGHVNLGGGTGDGTFESPAGTIEQVLAQAEEGDIVYVQPGTNPGVPGFTIPDGVVVLSSGTVQQIDTGDTGIIQLPLSGSGMLPLVIGTVILGNDTALSGFEIAGAAGPGIRGEDIENVTIQDNIIRNSRTNDADNLGYGIRLTNVTGTIDITNNSISDNFDAAIALENDQGEADLFIENNQIANNFSGISLNMSGSAELTTADVIGNSITNSGVGVQTRLSESAQLTDLTISNNTVAGSDSQGLYFEAFDDAEATTINVSDNTISNVIVPTVTSEDTGDGMFFALNQNAVVEQLIISGNVINTVSEDGISLRLTGDAEAIATISNNQITNVNSGGVFFGNIGIQVDADDNSQLQLLLESNTVTQSAEQGISIFAGLAGGNPQIATTVRLNTLTGNNVNSFVNSDFEAQTFAGATMCLRLNDNTSDTFTLINNGSGTFQAEVGANTGTVTPVETTAAPPFVGCTVP